MIMTTINDKLTYLNGTKDAIKQAIIAKGVEVKDTDTFRSYADKIEAIQAGGGGGIAGAPSGIKFNNSTFTTVPVEIIPYLEAQTDLSYIFQSCSSLRTVPQLDTKKATSMKYMFTLCNNLQTAQLNTVNVTNMKGMFQACRSLQTAPQLDTKKVTDTSWMFRECENLQTAQLNTVNVTNMEYMFQSCDNLQTAPQLDTKKVTNLNSMFAYCFSLATVPLLNVSSATNMSATFWSCKKLTNLGGFTGLKVNLDLSSSPLLTIDSVMNVINNAANMTFSPKTLTLHQDVFNKLIQEQIATASAKGWNIASA